MMRREVATHERAVHGGPHSARGGAAPGVIDYSSSIGPLGPPGQIVAALGRGIESALSYPDPEYAELREAVARARGVEAGEVTVGCGSVDLIYDWCRAFVSKGTRVLVQAPTFSEYAAAAGLCGGVAVEYPSMSLAGGLAGFVSSIPRKGCVVLCNPNNPTGELLRRKDVLEVASEAARRGSQVLVDETFIEFAPRGASVAGAAASRRNLHVVHSLTKTFGIPGVRVGYGIGNERDATAMRAAKMPWSVSGLAERVALAAMPLLASASHASHVRRARTLCHRERAYLREGIGGIRGCEVVGESAANFVLMRARDRSKRTLRDRLLARRALVRDCSSFSGLDSSYVRVSVRTRAENAALLGALRSA